MEYVMTHSPTPPETLTGDTASSATESTDSISCEATDSGATNDERGDGAKGEAQSDATSAQGTRAE